MKGHVPIFVLSQCTQSLPRNGNMSEASQYSSALCSTKWAIQELYNHKQRKFSADGHLGHYSEGLCREVAVVSNLKAVEYWSLSRVVSTIIVRLSIRLLTFEDCNTPLHYTTPHNGLPKTQCSARTLTS